MNESAINFYNEELKKASLKRKHTEDFQKELDILGQFIRGCVEGYCRENDINPSDAVYAPMQAAFMIAGKDYSYSEKVMCDINCRIESGEEICVYL